MPVWAGVAVAGGLGIYGAHQQSKAADKATQAETQAGDKALALQSQIYNQTRDDLGPYRAVGAQAFAGHNGLTNLLGLDTGALSAGGPSSVGTGAVGAAPSYGLTGDSSANYPLPMGAISDPNANGGFAGQVPGTSTLGSTSYRPNPQAPGYGPQSSPIPNMRFQHSDGSIYTIPASEVARAQREDPSGKVIGPA